MVILVLYNLYQHGWEPQHSQIPTDCPINDLANFCSDKFIPSASVNTVNTQLISGAFNNIFVLQYPPLDFTKFLEIDAQCTVSCTKRSAIKNVNNQYVPHWGGSRDKASYYLYDEDCENNLYRFEIKIETNSILLKDMFKNCSLLSGDVKQINWAASLDLRN
jgi:hypothetical protein